MTIVKAYRDILLFAILAVAMAMTAIQLRAETFVLPVVARGVPGINGSVWDSEVRISGPNMAPPGAITRLWVALPGGGFIDEPVAAPRWVFPVPTCPSFPCNYAGMFVLTGDQLLQGTQASKGAVAVDVEGTGNHVFLHNSNTLGQPRLPQDGEGPACCLPGNGQLVRGLNQPLVGEGFIPWITAGRSPYRVSVGIINPTGVARSLEVTAGPFQAWGQSPPSGPPGHPFWLGYQGGNGPLVTIDLPPWGFRQVDDFAAVLLQECPTCTWQDRVAPTAVWLTDNDHSGLPFYAYASVIWTPLNDPEFIPAERFVQ